MTGLAPWQDGMPWDRGVTWFSRRTVDPSTAVFHAEYVRDAVLKAADVTAELDWIDRAVRAATAAAEHDTGRALQPQTWEMVLSGFPASGRIVLPRPPLVSVDTVTYYDADGVSTDAGSPLPFEVVPSGRWTKAELRLPSGDAWPTTSVRGDAVTITYQAGYDDADDPDLELIKTGIALMVGELYKQRSLSLQTINNTPAVLSLERFWRPVY